MQMPSGLSIKEQHRWIWLLLYVAATVVAIASCSGGGGTVELGSRGQSASTVPGPVRATDELITEADIALLPAWQREKLSDPGWNQPYIEPRTPTEMPMPTYEMLQAFMEEQQHRDIQIQPRLADTRSASWLGQDGFDPSLAILKGEYGFIGQAETPPYGCNNDESSGRDGFAFEDVIREGTKFLPQSISYVLNGLSEANWFNTIGGTGNDAQSAVYQLFSSSREGVAGAWESSNHLFEELTYRADLAPGVGPGGDCSAAEAYLVTDLFWRRFNSTFNALPIGEEVMVYDILIAPSGERSALLTSSGNTAGRYQEFYCGTLGACFGGGWIVGVEASASGCRVFNDEIVEAHDTGLPQFYSPVFGVLLKRWQDTEIKGLAGPWDSWLGWPILGPVAHGNGHPKISPHGTYYAWGMWFERGFIWWVDYDQIEYPETPDEAHVYWFTGDNVFCPESGEYRGFSATVYYGGAAPWPASAGESRVSVVVDSYRNSVLESWKPLQPSEFNEYEISLGYDGLRTVQVAMHAHAWGGTPNSDCTYDHYVWAFRDGSISMGDEATAQYVTHTYGSEVHNREAVYTIRVQVTDSTGAVSYGDSLPIVLGHKPSGCPQPSIWVINNDNGVYPANYDALIVDLQVMGIYFNEVDYSGDVADDFQASNYAKAAIWYRGGPGAPGEEVGTREWTADVIDQLIALLECGVPVLLVSQDHGYNSPVHRGYGWGLFYGWDENQLAQSVPEGAERFLWALGMTEAAGIGITGEYGYLKSNPRNLPTTGPVGGKFATDGYDNDGENAAERYHGENSSGDIPLSISFGEPRQLVGYGLCSPLQKKVVAPNFVAGINCAEQFEGDCDIAFFSGGLTTAPYRNVGLWPDAYNFLDHGSARLWWIGYPWAQTVVTDSVDGSMVGVENRHMLLRNILAWLEVEL